MLAFDAISTQWRDSGNGPISLDYSSIPATFQLIGLPRKRWPDLFKDIRTMEDAALKLFAFQRQQRK